jgi:hypothetical protein
MSLLERKKKRKLYLYTMDYLHKYTRNVLDDNDDFLFRLNHF